MTGAAFSKSGVLAPSQAVEPARFLGWVEQAADPAKSVDRLM
jgi:hypothetical protein